MLNLKRLGGAVTLALALVLGGVSAKAATYDFGTIAAPGIATPLLGGAIGTSGQTLLVNSFQFDVAGPSRIDAFGFNVIPHIFNFVNLTAQLFTVAGHTAVTGPATLGSGFALSYAGLTSGVDYVLEITGTLGAGIFGNAGGLYLGAMAISAVPVPPALILFGTAIAGMAALGRRRSRKALPTA